MGTDINEVSLNTYYLHKDVNVNFDCISINKTSVYKSCTSSIKLHLYLLCLYPTVCLSLSTTMPLHIAGSLYIFAFWNFP